MTPMGVRDDYHEALNEPEWSRPKDLPPELLGPLQGRQRIWLAEAINLMLTGSTWKSDLHHIAKKQRAATALFRSCAQDIMALYGSRQVGTDASDRIPASYFDMPRNLGHGDNSIETDLGAVGMDEFVAARRGEHVRWFNVRVDASQFLAWMGKDWQARDASNAVGRPNKSLQAAFAAIDAAFPDGLPQEDSVDWKWTDIYATVRAKVPTNRSGKPAVSLETVKRAVNQRRRERKALRV